MLSDITGVSGQRIIEALFDDGETAPEQWAELAHTRVLLHKRAALEQAVVGRSSNVLRFVVRQQLRHLHDVEAQLEACDAQLQELLRPFDDELACLRSATGMEPRTAEIILVEVGLAIQRFPPASATWPPGLGCAPAVAKVGASAITRVRATAAHGCVPRWRRPHGAPASPKKGGYLPALFRRLAARRGKKRAIVAVGHSILATCYYLLTRGGTYHDLDETYFDKRDRQAVVRRSVRRLQALGYSVHLQELRAA